MCNVINAFYLRWYHTINPHKILKFNFSENDITEKPPFHPYAWKI